MDDLRNAAERLEKVLAGRHSISSPSGDAREWIEEMATVLDTHFDKTARRKIRAQCHCDHRLEEMKQWLRQEYENAGGVEQFVDAMNRHGAGWRYENGEIYTTFHTCECPVLAGIDGPVPETWCLCAEGYTVNVFSHVFARPVSAELLQTIRQGAKECVVKITLA